MLQIIHTAEGSAGHVVFEFVDGGSVDVGNVYVDFDIVYVKASYFNVRLLGQGGWSPVFCGLYTDDTGNLRLSDHAGYMGIIGTYPTSTIISYSMLFDTEADSYSLWMDGKPLVTDRYHGAEGGIGRLVFTIDHQTPLDHAMWIDNVFLSADEYTPVAGSTFSELKALY